MPIAEVRRRITCFAPLGGVLFGLAVGWLLGEHFQAEDVRGAARVLYDLAVRFVEFSLALNFWAYAVVHQQERALHCGGTQALSPEDKPRLTRLVHWQLAFLLLAVMALYQGGWFLLVYVLVALGSMATYFCEIAWSDPFRWV